MKTITVKLAKLLQQRNDKQRAPTLGTRELDVMKILWQADALSAKQVLEKLGPTALSLSTMQSTLERLHRKELITREKSGRHYLYCAVVSQSDMVSQLMGEISEQIADGDLAPMISGFMSFMGTDKPKDLNLNSNIEHKDNKHTPKG